MLALMLTSQVLQLIKCYFKICNIQKLALINWWEGWCCGGAKNENEGIDNSRCFC